MAWGRAARAAGDAVVGAVADRLAVNFGAELARIVPGRVSTEVDADLSFDTQATVEKARAIIAAYEARGIGRERILIKIAATWEGIRAAEILQREGIDCNLTLLFSLVQAAACAEAEGLPDLALRRPHPRLARQGRGPHLRAGGGSGRPVGAPDLRLLQAPRLPDRRDGRVLPQRRRDRGAGRLRPADHRARRCWRRWPATTGTLPRQLDPAAAAREGADRVATDERAFRWAMNEDAMATEKLAEGIRQFAKDLRTLRGDIATRLAKAA